MNTRIESDLDIIIAAALAQRIGNMAASVRAAQSEVEPYESHEPYDYRRPGHVLAARGMSRVSTPGPVLNGPTADRLPWWHHPWVARAQRADLIAGLCVGVVGMVIHLLAVVIDSAAGRVGLSAPALIVAVAAGVVFASMVFRGGRSGGGGKRISGTFEGRVH